MRMLAAILILTILSIGIHAQSRPGQQAPVLHLDTVLQGEEILPKRGRALLIDFWASWCQPCIASIPHLNALAEQFGGKRLDFLWLSGESVDKVKPFLQRHPMSGTVALDSKSALWRAFDGRTLPTTVLIDSTGKIAAITTAELVNAEVLTALLDGRSLPLRPLEIDSRIADHRLLSGQKTNDSNADSRMVVRRTSQAGGSLGSRRLGQYETSGSQLRLLLAEAYGVSPFLIHIPDYLDQLYAVEGWVPNGHPETFGPLMQAALSSAACIRVYHRAQVRNVLVLSGLPGHLQIVAGLEEGFFQPGNISWKNASAETIRSSIELATGELVVIDHPVSGTFDFNLNWNPSDAGSLADALRKQSLVLSRQKRTVDVLVVEDLDNRY